MLSQVKYSGSKAATLGHWSVSTDCANKHLYLVGLVQLNLKLKDLTFNVCSNLQTKIEISFK